MRRLFGYNAGLLLWIADCVYLKMIIFKVFGGGIFHSMEGTRETTRVPSMFGRSAAKPKLCVPGGLVIGPLYDGVYWPGKVRPKNVCSSGKKPG